MTGAVFFNAEFTAPWGFTSPPAQRVAPLVAPGTERLVIYHLVTEGRAIAKVEDQEEVLLEGGDIVVFPHGDAHRVSNGYGSGFVDSTLWLTQFLSGSLTVTRFGGGGESTQFICGYFGCERHASRLFLAGLPSILKVRIRGTEGGDWLDRSIRYSVSAAASGRPGHSALVSKLSEALFIETLRRYMDELSSSQTGWLAGARDELVGATLALLHKDSSRNWTLAGLAGEVGTSRSVLADRFAHFLGEPPITYLARWRLQLGARLLQTTSRTVTDVALEVGYESESAFNRAFKREFGSPPARFRKQSNEGRNEFARSRSPERPKTTSTAAPS
jgi:AraC-like DNA-binding protein